MAMDPRQCPAFIRFTFNNRANYFIVLLPFFTRFYQLDCRFFLFERCFFKRQLFRGGISTLFTVRFGNLFSQSRYGVVRFCGINLFFIVFMLRHLKKAFSGKPLLCFFPGKLYRFSGLRFINRWNQYRFLVFIAHTVHVFTGSAVTTVTRFV